MDRDAIQLDRIMIVAAPALEPGGTIPYPASRAELHNLRGRGHRLKIFFMGTNNHREPKAIGSPKRTRERKQCIENERCCAPSAS
jgi:hypothetical protein